MYNQKELTVQPQRQQMAWAASCPDSVMLCHRKIDQTPLCGISKMSHSYKGKPEKYKVILFLVPTPFPYTASTSQAWKQDAEGQLFGPIKLSQNCI